jgi:site-specific DNA-cytosine methylase
MTERPGMTVTAGGTYTGGAETFGKGARNGIDRERAAGRWAPWMDTRPATTVQGDPRVSGPGHKDGRPGSGYPRQQDGACPRHALRGRRAADLPPDYPWHGKLGKQHMQAGNAVPPRLAEALLRVVVEQVSGGRLNLAALGI